LNIEWTALSSTSSDPICIVTVESGGFQV